MKELQQIVRRVIENPTERWALATLVQTEGSSYRKPGARCLIDTGGATLGVLSGGCLEEEIGRRGQRVIANGAPIVLSFDTRLLYGCDGRLKILVEPIPAAGKEGNLITLIGDLLGRRNVCRVCVSFQGELLGSELLERDALIVEHGGLLIETIPLPIRLLLFGRGPEIAPLLRLAENLGWIVEHVPHPSGLRDDFRPDMQTAALVMNHNFGRDLVALDRLLSLDLRYVGLLGPQKRRAELLTRLSEYRSDDFAAGPKNLFAPAGLDIGSETPEEIALAIVSEVAAVLANRCGGSLRDRKSEIHARSFANAGGEAA
jgi:xanthine/CO dehydrogenase XdhC/CoxF family maturation factor